MRQADMAAVPTDLQDLAKSLGYSLKQLRKLGDKHGDALIGILQRRWVDQVPEKTRLLHRDSSHGYTDRPEQRMGTSSQKLPGTLSQEPEAVSAEDQQRITDQVMDSAAQAATLLAATRAAQPLAERLAGVMADIPPNGRSDLRVIERRIEALEARRAS